MRRLFVHVIFLSFSSIRQSQSETLQVVGPEAPLVAAAGEDLVLPCSIKPTTSAVDMTVEWLRLEEVATLVHLYLDNKDRNEGQVQHYIGRTSLFKEELQKGNASLKLSHLRVSDEGEYKCLIHNKSWDDDFTVNVIVEAQGSQPVITMENYDHSGGIYLVCESRGWNPEPEIVWLNREGDTLPAEDTQIHRDTEGFSVKRSITVHDYSNDNNRFYCRIQQTHHMMETEIIINGKIFHIWKWIVGISVSACVITVGLILTAVICYEKASELQREKQNAAILVSDLQNEKAYTEFFKNMFAVEVTLDPDTANPFLIVSADGKQVTCGNTKQDLPDTPQRFTVDPCVLGKQIFSKGRFYYEVQVTGLTHWILGVVGESINRKEWNIRRPLYGIWTVGLYGNEYKARTDPAITLTLREKVEKVGVFVDCEEGLVSFYDVNSRSHIYSFKGQTFKENLYPFFNIWVNDRVPLICI